MLPRAFTESARNEHENEHTIPTNVESAHRARNGVRARAAKGCQTRGTAHDVHNEEEKKHARDTPLKTTVYLNVVAHKASR